LRLYPPPGRLVDVGGHRLHFVCAGNGTPVVLFEMSGFSNSTSFSDARTAIARRTRVCTYDRMGIGWSDPGPSSISAGMLVEDLRKLLDASGIKAPIVIVASSIGGLTTELFARRFPDRVAGLVFLDAANSEAIARYDGTNVAAAARALCGAVYVAGNTGLVRLIDPWHMRRDRSAQNSQSAALMYGGKPWVMLCSMVRAYETTRQDFAGAPALDPRISITALSAENSRDLLPPALASLFDVPDASRASLRATHQHLASHSTRGQWRLVTGSGHLIASDKPQTVVDAVFEMITN
jgi:pimeloyl-ACP methyl ester carboxylesterase